MNLAFMKKEQTTNKQFSLDEIDRQLLGLLQENAKYTVRELSAKVNLSPTPIHERIKRLESSKIIDHYAAIVNRDQLEHLIIFYVNIKLKEHSTKQGSEFIKQISAFPEVVEFYTIGGEHDFMVKVIVSDMKQYKSFFVNKLGEIPNIVKLQSIIVLDTIKHEVKIPL